MKYFTSGPWEARVGYATDDYPKVKDIRILGPVKDSGWQTVLGTVLMNPNESEAVANAHMMAASPELYESLKDLLLAEDPEDFRIAKLSAERALAKAEGKK
jgi:D-serine deaminase-like pyridoxal phosphate-dependent protein